MELIACNEYFVIVEAIQSLVWLKCKLLRNIFYKWIWKLFDYISEATNKWARQTRYLWNGVIEKTHIKHYIDMSINININTYSNI